MLYISEFKIDWLSHLDFDNSMVFGEGVNLLIGKNGSGKTSVLRKLDAISRNENIGLDPDALSKYQDNAELSKLTCMESNGSESTAVLRRQNNTAQWQNWQFLQDKTRFITSDRRITMSSSATNLIPNIQRDISIPNVGEEIDISLEFTQAVLKDLWQKIEKTTSSENIGKEIVDDYQNGLIDFEKTIKIDLKRSQNPIYFVDYRGMEVQINDLSSGEKEYLYFYAFLRRMSNEGDKIVLIDEPELHLHSSQLRKLCEMITNLGERNQIIIATHSGEILQSFINANIVSLNRGRIVNIKSSIELRNALEDIGLPIDPSVFTSHWICAENDPSVSLKGQNAPKTPEILSWIFGNSITRKFWSFGQNKENAEAVVTGILQTSAKPTSVKLSVILDGDKLVKSPSNFVPKVPDPKGLLNYWPFWELENLFIMPEILDKTIETNKRLSGSKRFWNEVIENKDKLFLEIHKTVLKNFLREYKVDKLINKKPKDEFGKWKRIVSQLQFDDSTLKEMYEAAIQSKDWQWIPGKEALTLVLKLDNRFWEKIRELVKSGEFQKIIKNNGSLVKLITKMDEPEN